MQTFSHRKSVPYQKFRFRLVSFKAFIVRLFHSPQLIEQCQNQQAQFTDFGNPL